VKPLHFRSLKEGSSMLNVVCLERVEHKRSFEAYERPVLKLKADMLKFLYA
jgi:hypothetical protein